MVQENLIQVMMLSFLWNSMGYRGNIKEPKIQQDYKYIDN